MDGIDANLAKLLTDFLALFQSPPVFLLMMASIVTVLATRSFIIASKSKISCMHGICEA